MACVQSSLVYFHFKYFKTHRGKWSHPKHQNYRPSNPTTVGFNLNPLNYRPASITCVIWKILESMRKSGLNSLIYIHNIYTQYQTNNLMADIIQLILRKSRIYGYGIYLRKSRISEWKTNVYQVNNQHSDE